jgi:hypothetical protein
MRALPEPYVLVILLLDAVLLLFLFERLLSALRAGMECCRSFYSTREFLGNNYLCASARQIFVLLLPFYAITLVVTDVSRIGFGWTLLALVALALFRILAGRLTGWLSGQNGTFRSLERINEALCVLAIFASLPVFVLGWLAPEIPHWLLWGALSLIALGAAVVYVLRGTQIILSAQFPIYYWVLYLCALEFLPICVVANILINGN